MAKPLTDKALIQEIGREEIARETGRSAEAVKKWMQRGIPWQYRAKVAKLAAARKLKVRPDFIEQRKAAA